MPIGHRKAAMAAHMDAAGSAQDEERLGVLLRSALPPVRLRSPLREDPTVFFLRKVVLEDGREFQ